MLIEYNNKSELTLQIQEWMLSLIELNVGKYYKESFIGWNKDRKRRELFEEEKEMFYIVKQSNDLCLEGFVAALDTIEGGERVLYCYEVQLEEYWRGKGGGTALMNRFHDIAIKKGIKKVMLTCFKSNILALGFYSKINYSIDTYGPDEDDDEFDYVILSRLLMV